MKNKIHKPGYFFLILKELSNLKELAEKLVYLPLCHYFLLLIYV